MPPKEKEDDKPEESAKEEEPKKPEEAAEAEEEAEAEEDAEAEEAAEEEAVAVKEEPEKAKELEEDAPADSRKRVAADAVSMNLADTTLNVLPTAGGKLLGALHEGGLQYLLAGARAGVGVKAGRYLFEVRLTEMPQFEDTR